MQKELLVSTGRTKPYLTAAKTAYQNLKDAYETLGPRHPDLAFLMQNLALLCKTLQNDTLARPLFQKALDQLERQFGTGIPVFYSAMNYLGGKCELRSADAAYHPKKATVMAVEISADGLPVTPDVHNRLNGHPVRFKQALIVWKSAFSPEFPELEFTNVLSMVFTEETLPEFIQQLDVDSIKEVSAVTLTGLAAELQSWKLRCEPTASLSSMLGIVNPPAPNGSANGFSVTQEILFAEEEEEEEEEFAIDPPLLLENDHGAEQQVETETPEMPDEYQEESIEIVEPLEKHPDPQPDPSVNAAEELANLVANKLQRNDRLEDLNLLIQAKNRRRFVKKLFNKNDGTYHKLITHLNHVQSWQTASEVIEQHFYQFGIYPYSKEALEFSDAVYGRYFPKEARKQRSGKF